MRRYGNPMRPSLLRPAQPQQQQQQPQRPVAPRPAAAAPAAAAAATPNGSTPLFQQITNDRVVLNSAFSKTSAFRRAVKVFLMSYPEMKDSKSQFMLRKFSEYLQTIKDIFEVTTNDMSFLATMYTSMKSETIHIYISPKRIRGGQGNLYNPKLIANFRNRMLSCDLNDRKEYQDYNPMTVVVPYDRFLTMRSDPSNVIRLEIQERVGQTVQASNPPFNYFDFIVANTTPDGFEDWVDFGRNLQILINVEYKVPNETNITPEEVSQFHIQTIYHMLKKRISDYNSRARWADIGHQSTAFKYDISYRRPYATSEADMFWESPQSGLQLVPDVTRPRRRPSTVKFIDIQTAWMSTEDFKDNVCLCTEWCNLNAFFHHNPIYRFLLVKHHQLYMRNVTNVPDMYLFATASLANSASQKLPLFELMDCANEYRKKYYNTFGMRSLRRNVFMVNYTSARPVVFFMNALIYNRLRNDVNITKVCHQLAVNPFDDFCNDALIAYYRVLSDLHLFHSRNNQFVADQKLWSGDFDTVCRNKYGQYFKDSYDRCFSVVPGGYDYMFTVDFEYADKFARTEQIRELRRRRDHIMKKTPTDSPFNLKITVNKFLNMFLSISKFLSSVIPKLPAVYRSESLRAVITASQTMDTDLQQYSTDVNNTFGYRFDSNNCGYNNFDQNFHVFYTLKIYSNGFQIQRNCIDSFARFVGIYTSNTTQICTDFNFIWLNMSSMIEQNYRNQYPGESLFQLNLNFQQLFDDFYVTFWGKSPHELNPSPTLATNIRTCKDQYRKLYFWMKNDGNNKRKFLKIIEALQTSLLELTDSTEIVLIKHILPAIYEWSQREQHLQQRKEYFYETFDHLVYYLVKANCSVLLSISATFVKAINSIQTPGVTAIQRDFSMIKPGWVPLLRTINPIMDTIDRIEAFCVPFEDEFDRLSNTCSLTRKLIKIMFEQIYKKLCTEWISELATCFTQLPALPHIGDEFAYQHVANGLSFTAAFFNLFRSHFRKFRKQLLFVLRIPSHPAAPHQVMMNACVAPVLDYLLEKPMIDTANPLQSTVWRTALAAKLGPLDSLTAIHLRIDMNAANV